MKELVNPKKRNLKKISYQLFIHIWSKIFILTCSSKIKIRRTLFKNEYFLLKPFGISEMFWQELFQKLMSIGLERDSNSV